MSLDQVVFESRPLDHEDERRVLVSAFNGDFRAESVLGFSTTNMGASLCTLNGDIMGVPTNTLFHILSGSAKVMVEGQEENYVLRHQGDSRDRLILPEGRGYLVTIGPNSRLSVSLEQAEPKRFGNLWLYGTHQDINDRTQKYINPGKFNPTTFVSAEVRTLFSRGETGFTAAQLKFLLPFDQEVVLGGHYHNYGEVYRMWSGEAFFRLQRPLTADEITSSANPEQREVRITAQEGDYFSNPSGIAHGAKIGARSILVGCTAEAFQGNDSAKTYKNGWLMFKE